MGRVTESRGECREPGIHCVCMHINSQECWRIHTTNGYFCITNTSLELWEYTDVLCWQHHGWVQVGSCPCSHTTLAAIIAAVEGNYKVCVRLQGCFYLAANWFWQVCLYITLPFVFDYKLGRLGKEDRSLVMVVMPLNSWWWTRWSSYCMWVLGQQLFRVEVTCQWCLMRMRTWLSIVLSSVLQRR